MSVVWNSRFQKHYSQRILQNEVRETPSIPVRRVRKTFSSTKGTLYLLFIHPRALNLISLRSAGTMPA